MNRREILTARGGDGAPLPIQPATARAEAVVLKALGDETRLQIVAFLAQQSEACCACEVESLFSLSQPTISHHLKVLRDAGLVSTERRGVWIYYRLAPVRLRRLLEDVAAFWPELPLERVGNQMLDSTDIRAAVRERYARAALRVIQPSSADQGCCCGGGRCGESPDPITSNLYERAELSDIPNEAVLASLGCGNPTALAELKPGEVVLDLGSGGGINVLLSAKRVGPTGRAYGLDMTDEMLALARTNAERAGATNVEFLKGQIEDIPLPDASVDVVISNCVINLSTDKSRVIREAFRVLKPGGRLAVSDVVVEGPVPGDLRRQVELWVGCIAGALDRDDYAGRLKDGGFVEISIEPTRFYSVEDLDDDRLDAWLSAQPGTERRRLNHAFYSAFVRGQKPGV